jgi:hypothetical protein
MIRQKAYKESSDQSFKQYQDYLKMNGHQPLVRHQYKAEDFKQMDKV